MNSRPTAVKQNSISKGYRYGSALCTVSSNDMLSLRHLSTSWWSALVMCGLIFGNRFFSWTCSLCCKNQTNINLFSAFLAQFWTIYFFIIVMTGSLAEKEFCCNFPGYDKDKIVMSFELLIVFSWIIRTLLSVLGFLSGSRLQVMATLWSLFTNICLL